MTAATITDKVYEKGQAVPGQEVVVLTATDGETYVAKTMARVDSAICTFNEDMGASFSIPISLAISGKTVTIHCEGVTDKKVCLVCYGV
jgi:hypothetical protein